MPNFPCVHCGKSCRSEAGLAKHQTQNTSCIRKRQVAERAAKRDNESKPSAKKSKRLGMRKGQLEEDESQQPSKTRMVLDSDTMQRLEKLAMAKDERVDDLVQMETQNLRQPRKDPMGWLPYQRQFGREFTAMMDPGAGYSSEEDQGISGEDSMMVEEDGSVVTGDEGGAIGSGDDASDVVVETQEERFHRLSRREQYVQRFREYVKYAKGNFMNLSDSEQRAVRIMHKLVKKRAPLDTYKDVMAWHLRECGLLGYHESVGKSPHFISREKLMKKLRKRYHMDHQYAQGVDIILPYSKSKVTVWTKSAQDAILSLVTDPRWTAEDWLLDGDDPFARPPENLDYISDLNTGLAYLATHEKLITKANQILVGLPLYIDGAVTGQFDKLNITALKVTIGTLNRKARDKEYAWRTLGYVTNYTKEDTKGRQIFVQSGHVAAHELYVDGITDDEDEGGVEENEEEVDKLADYHAILSVLLASLKQVIADGLTVDLHLKGKLYEDVELVFFVPFVKCDGDEGDKLCAHMRVRNMNMKQLCRYCQCPVEDTDDPKANYPFKTEPMLRKLYEEKNVQKLQQLSQNCINNAFHGIRFGLHNDRGIHGATPWELLHAVLLGIYKYVRDCFFQQLGETSRSAHDVNSLAQEIGRLLQRQSDRNKPRTKFAKGILKGKLMAKEYAGVLLVMAALLQSAKGKEMLQSARRKNFRQLGQIDDWILLVETLLQWEAFLNLPRMDKNHVHRLKKKHQYLLYLLKRVGARDKGMGFKVMKFHAVLHLALDILMFGVPMVVDTGSNESHHKTTKLAARLTQKDVTTFEKQTSDRLDDFHVLELALQDIKGCPLWSFYDEWIEEMKEMEDNPEEEDKINTTGGMILNVFRDNNNNLPSFKVVTRMKNKKAVTMNLQLLQYFLQIQEDVAQFIEKIPICAEHCRGHQIFWSHPNYRGKGSWRDWVMIDWERHGEYPAQIWGFIDLLGLPEGMLVSLMNGTKVRKGVWAVIESCNFVNQVEERGIFKHIILETEENDDEGYPNTDHRKFYLVDVDTFKSPVVVIPNIGTKCEYLMMNPREKWAEDFKSWLEAPHTADEAEMRSPEPSEEEEEDEDREDEEDEDGEDEEEEEDEEGEEDEEEDEEEDG